METLPFSPEEMLSRVIYRDVLMLVLDKPAGIPVHPGSGGGITLEHYFDGLRYGLPEKPSLAHRLDRDTSGCLVLGRHRQALKRLGELFAAGRIEKTYLAVVEGTPADSEGRIDLKLGKQSAAKHRWRMQPDPLGQVAITDYRVLANHGNMRLLALTPLTGRTHQLRVHCAASGFPILGDRHYGTGDSTLCLHLHAWRIHIPLYPKKNPIMVEAPLPAPFSDTLQRLFGESNSLLISN